MTPGELAPRDGEIAVIGLARSGRAVAALLKKQGYEVYASDVASSPETGRCAEELRALAHAGQATGPRGQRPAVARPAGPSVRTVSPVRRPSSAYRYARDRRAS